MKYRLPLLFFLLLAAGIVFSACQSNPPVSPDRNENTAEPLSSERVSSQYTAVADAFQTDAATPTESTAATQPLPQENTTDGATPIDTQTETPASVSERSPIQSTAETSVLPPTQDTGTPQEPVPQTDAQRILNTLSLEEKVGQLFIIRPGADLTGITPALTQTLQDYPPGGVILFQPNVTGPDQITAFTAALKQAGKIPLFVAVDEEGGRVARLANHEAFSLPKYESAASVGSTGKTENALAMGSTIGAYLKQYGFNLNCAPVADVNTNPDNPIIGTRAFSPDPQVASAMAKAMAQGLKSQGILPVFKHFPGHGDTAEDSHSGLAVNYKTRAELELCEWLPYAGLTEHDCVMVGHIALPAVTQTMTPATLCPQIVTQILRKQLNFQGLILTDSLNMGALTNQYSSAEAAVLALEAGCDILLDPPNYPEAFAGVLSAVEQGRISEARLNESVLRILEYKIRYGIIPQE